MSSASFDELIHARNRLKICALLAPVASLEFIVLCEQLGVSDSVLSKHIKSLVDADYVVINKKTSEGQQRTWLSLSPAGRKAFNGHVAALKEIVGEAPLRIMSVVVYNSALGSSFSLRRTEMICRISSVHGH